MKFELQIAPLEVASAYVLLARTLKEHNWNTFLVALLLHFLAPHFGMGSGSLCLQGRVGKLEG